MKDRTSPFRILRNFSFLTIGKVGGDIFTFFLFVILSRTFGQEGIGQYSFAVALTGFFAVFADFGLYNFSVKEMSRRTSEIGEYYGGIYLLRIILSVAAFTVLLLILPFLPFAYATKLIIMLIGAYQLLYTLVDGCAAVFVAREAMHMASFLELSLRIAIALVGITVAAVGGSLIMVLATFPILTFCQLLVASRLVAREYGRFRLVASWSGLKRMLDETLPYGLAELLRQLSSRVDVVFLGFFLGAAMAGIYSVAYRVVFLLLFLPYLAGLALFPVASRWSVNSWTALEALYHQSLSLAILIGLPAAAGLWLIAPDIIALVFGETFAESASLLGLLAWLLLFGCLKSLMGTFLMSCDRQVESVRSQWVAAGVNVLGNILLIPIFGIKGAAIAVLVSELLVVIRFAVLLKAVFGWPRVGLRLAMSGVATASFCLPLAVFPSLSLSVVIPASMLLYCGVLLLFKEIRRNEFRILLSLLKRGPDRLTSEIGWEAS